MTTDAPPGPDESRVRGGVQDAVAYPGPGLPSSSNSQPRPNLPDIASSLFRPCRWLGGDHILQLSTRS